MSLISFYKFCHIFQPFFQRNTYRFHQKMSIHRFLKRGFSDEVTGACGRHPLSLTSVLLEGAWGYAVLPVWAQAEVKSRGPRWARRRVMLPNLWGRESPRRERASGGGRVCRGFTFLLKYTWLTVSCGSQVCSIVIQHLYTLRSVHHGTPHTPLWPHKVVAMPLTVLPTPQVTAPWLTPESLYLLFPFTFFSQRPPFPPWWPSVFSLFYESVSVLFACFVF